MNDRNQQTKADLESITASSAVKPVNNHGTLVYELGNGKRAQVLRAGGAYRLDFTGLEPWEVYSIVNAGTEAIQK